MFCSDDLSRLIAYYAEIGVQIVFDRLSEPFWTYDGATITKYWAHVVDQPDVTGVPNGYNNVAMYNSEAGMWGLLHVF
jgi:hypothetical protein